MTETRLKIILTGRGWSELPCTHCEKPIQVGDRVVSHGQRPRRNRRLVKIYHKDCYEKMRDCTQALIKRWCPVCKRETAHDTQKWEDFSVCTECGVLIPYDYEYFMK